MTDDRVVKAARAILAHMDEVWGTAVDDGPLTGELRAALQELDERPQDHILHELADVAIELRGRVRAAVESIENELHDRAADQIEELQDHLTSLALRARFRAPAVPEWGEPMAYTPDAPTEPKEATFPDHPVVPRRAFPSDNDTTTPYDRWVDEVVESAEFGGEADRTIQHVIALYERVQAHVGQRYRGVRDDEEGPRFRTDAALMVTLAAAFHIRGSELSALARRRG